YFSHSLDPLNGCFSLHRCVCQFPNSQSKSCCLSRTDAGRAVDDAGGAVDDAGRAVSGAAEFSCASAATPLTISDKPGPKNPRIIDQTITRFTADPFDMLRAGSAAATGLPFLVTEETPKAFGDDLGNPPRLARFAVVPSRPSFRPHLRYA